MSADTNAQFDLGSMTPPVATLSDNVGGGAGRGGSSNGALGPLVVVQQPRNAAPPRPAPRPSRGDSDNSLRNGYAAISHSVSGEAAAIGLGFLVAGPVGAVVGGATLPALVAASVWRARRREDDENANQNDTNGTRNANNGGTGRDRSGSSGGGRTGSGRGGGQSSGGGGRGRGDGSGGSGGGRHKTPKGAGSGGSKGTGAGAGLGGGKHSKPKTKDPIADKLGKFGKGLADKLKNKRDKNGKGSDDPKGPKGPKDQKTPKSPKDKGTKDPKGDSKDGPKRKDRVKQPDSDRPWRGRGDKNKKNPGAEDGTTSSTARDGLPPRNPQDHKGPKNPKDPHHGGGAGADEVVDAELVDDDVPPKPDNASGDVIDGEVIDEDRIALIRARRERTHRRRAVAAGKKAASDAARDGTQGDPLKVKLERIRTENHRIDLELHHVDQMIALAASTQQRRSTPVTYPVATTQPAGTRTAGAAVARQVDVRGSTAYRLLVAMAEQLANGLHHDDDADMADHVVELAGIPAMCRNLAAAVREAAGALQKTAPLHPSVVKHLNNAAVAALTAARMADTILIVFVQAHREDIFRVMSPRLGEERWNIRNAAGTLDAAKLRAAIMSSGQQRLALPAGSSPSGSGSGKLVPASDGSTKKLIALMQGFNRGHMVTCLSEVAGAASGMDVVADSVTKLYHRMAKTWPTENVVDDTVRATAAKVKTIADELRKAINAARRAHERELRLNAKPRKGANSEKKWDVAGR